MSSEGVVIRIDGGGHHVDAAGQIIRCRVRGRLRRENREFKNPVAVGDRVIWVSTGPQEGVIEAVGPRRSYLSRPAVGQSSRQQILAANVDQVVIVVSTCEPPLRPAFIDRILIGAARGQMEAVICLNKVDLDEQNEARQTMAIYESIGYRVIYTSAMNRAGLIPLREALTDQTSVVAGHSGVGKSSLLAALMPGLGLATGEVSQRTGRGRHTTTSASLIPLEFGGYVVDTPGVRAFGIMGLEPYEVAHFYPEMRPYIDGCRFKTCTHTHEPGCEVQEAHEAGHISGLRYHSYSKLVESIQSGEEGEERSV